MKKILFVATVDSHIRNFHLPYLKMMSDKGWEVHVATNGKEKFPYCNKKHTICMERSPFKPNNLKAIKQMKRLLKKEHFDIIHCHTPMGSVVTRMAAKEARKNGTRVIYTAHGFHFYTGAPLINWLLFYPVEKYLAKYTDTLITINKEDYNRAKKKFSKRCHDIQYVPGVGIDPKKFDFEMTAKEKHDLRASLGLKDDDFVMIFPARLDKNKNQGFLIKCMPELIKENPKIHLLLPGQDELNGKYQKLAKRLNVDNNVHFLGIRNDIPKLLKISNLAVSSSKREGLPVNILEAMASNIQIVALDCRGCRDILSHTDNTIVTKRTQKEMTKAILNIHYGKNAVDKSIYTVKSIADALRKIYFKKKRIMHLLSSNKYSGAENVACQIIKQTNKYEYVYCSPRGEIENALKKMGIKYYGIGKVSSAEILRAVKEYKPDIIHAHDYKASIYAAMAKKGNTRLISHIHKNDPCMSRISLKSALYSIISHKIDRVIVVSQEIIDESPLLKKLEKKTIILHPFVNKKDILEKAKEKIEISQYDMLFFGRLSEEKNPFLFLDIVKKMGDTSIKAIMLGDGPLMEKCKKKAAIDKISNVKFLGFKENPYPYIKKAKICIMPSLFEGFGISAIEVLLLGVPVLNSGVGGLKYIFKDNKEMICKSEIEYIKRAKKYILNRTKISYDYHIKATDFQDKIVEIYGA